MNQFCSDGSDIWGATVRAMSRQRAPSSTTETFSEREIIISSTRSFATNRSGSYHNYNAEVCANIKTICIEAAIRL